MIGEKFDKIGRIDKRGGSFTCPYCDVKFYEAFSILKTEVVIYCKNCRKPVYIVIDKEGIVTDQYPKSTIKLPEEIPKKIRVDFKEAIKCFNSGAYKATVTMCRRALQNSTIDLGASKNKRLIEQINELYDKRIIPDGIKDWSHEIRQFGNFGAHPQDDRLENINEEDSKNILSFLEDFCKYVYVMPEKVEKHKRVKQQKKTTQS